MAKKIEIKIVEVFCKDKFTHYNLFVNNKLVIKEDGLLNCIDEINRAYYKASKERDDEIMADKFFNRMSKMTKLELRRQIEKMYNEIKDLRRKAELDGEEKGDE